MVVLGTLKLSAEVQRKLSSSKMRLRSSHPFLTVLLSYLKPVELTKEQWYRTMGPYEPTIATDARRLLITRDFFLSLTHQEVDFVVMHEALHASLGHCWRVGSRTPGRWNVACDHVVNLILIASGLRKPANAPGYWDPKYSKMTAEEVYSLLSPDCEFAITSPFGRDLMPGSGVEDVDGAGSRELESYWNSAKKAAEVYCRSQGKDPALDELVVQLERSNTDWRKVLWSDFPMSSHDFTCWDRRLIYDEVYVEDLEPTNNAFEAGVFIDSSGSMVEILGKVIGQVKRICELYPEMRVDAYFADADIFGPIPLKNIEKHVRGGGGTSFVPAFELVEKKKYKKVVYLTDLYGTFPNWIPKAETIWVTGPGSMVEPPFGRVVKVLADS